MVRAIPTVITRSLRLCSPVMDFKVSGLMKVVIRIQLPIAMRAPSRAPRASPIRSSFQTTRKNSEGVNSPSDMARMTIVAACDPVLPPVATIMGM